VHCRRFDTSASFLGPARLLWPAAGKLEPAAVEEAISIDVSCAREVGTLPEPQPMSGEAQQSTIAHGGAQRLGTPPVGAATSLLPNRPSHSIQATTTRGDHQEERRSTISQRLSTSRGRKTRTGRRSGPSVQKGSRSRFYTCQMCHSALSVPRTNASSRPSALFATAMLLVSSSRPDAQPAPWGGGYSETPLGTASLVL
jgi:hypothetical protein